jgi:hypothetical protein
MWKALNDSQNPLRVEQKTETEGIITKSMTRGDFKELVSSTISKNSFLGFFYQTMECSP